MPRVMGTDWLHFAGVQHRVATRYGPYALHGPHEIVGGQLLEGVFQVRCHLCNRGTSAHSVIPDSQSIFHPRVDLGRTESPFLE